MTRLILVISVWAVVCGLLAGLPLRPPTKMAVLAGMTAAGSLFLLCLSVYVAWRRPARRSSVLLVGLPVAAGFACFSVALRIMSQTWDIPRAERPFGTGFAWLGGGALSLLIGILGLIRAASPPTRSADR